MNDLLHMFSDWLDVSWKWVLAWLGTITLTQFHTVLGIVSTLVMIVLGVLNAIRVWKDIRRK